MSGIERWVHRVPFAGSDALVACDASPRDEGAAATAAVPRAKQRPKSRKDKVDGANKDGTSMDADAAVEVVDLASAAASAKDSTGGTPDFDEAVLAKEFTDTPDMTAAENATEEEVDFEQWLKNEGCDPRRKIGQRFGRSTAAKEASYKSASQTEKREMRRKWGEAEIARLKETRTFAKCWAKVDQTKGTYVPFAVLWEREGGVLDPRGALAAAMEYARACIRMKGPRVSANPVTGRLEYLHLERSVKEQFTKCWTLFKSEAEAAPCGKGQGDNGADSSTRLSGQEEQGARRGHRRRAREQGREEKASGRDAAPAGDRRRGALEGDLHGDDGVRALHRGGRCARGRVGVGEARGDVQGTGRGHGAARGRADAVREEVPLRGHEGDQEGYRRQQHENQHGRVHRHDQRAARVSRNAREGVGGNAPRAELGFGLKAARSSLEHERWDGAAGKP